MCGNPNCKRGLYTHKKDKLCDFCQWGLEYTVGEMERMLTPPWWLTVFGVFAIAWLTVKDSAWWLVALPVLVICDVIIRRGRRTG